MISTHSLPSDTRLTNQSCCVSDRWLLLWPDSQTTHTSLCATGNSKYYSGLTQYSLSSQFAFVSCTSECPTGDPQTPTQDKQKPEKTRTKREFSYVAYDFFVIDRRLSTNLAWLGTDYPLSLLLLLIQALELLQCLCCCELLCVAVDGFRMY